MSMAMKYNMQKRAKKMAKGGYCAKGCSVEHMHNYAEGGDVKGVHKPIKAIVDDEHGMGEEARGVSKAGILTRQGRGYSAEEEKERGYYDDAKAEHKRVLGEMKTMPRPHGDYAEGGFVEDDDDSGDSFEGYNKDKAKKVSDSFMGSEGYAEGGFVDEEEASGYQPDPTENPEHMYQHDIPNQDHDSKALDMVESIMQMRSMAKGYSQGGQVADDVGEGQDADREANQFDNLVKSDDDMEGADYTGANSGDEIGNATHMAEDEDTVDQIMRSRKKKDRLPNPR